MNIWGGELKNWCIRLVLVNKLWFYVSVLFWK